MVTGPKPEPLVALGAAVSLLLSLLLPACGQGGDGRIDAAVADTSIDSPLNYLLGVGEGEAAGLQAIEQAAQEKLVSCMTEAGFTYIPVEPVVPEMVAGATNGSLDEGASADHGYGIADSLERARRDRDSAVDPNEEVRNDLGPEEQRAYDEAMSGLAPDEVTWDEATGFALDPATGEVLSPQEFEAASSDGCLHQAYGGGGVGQEVVQLLAGSAYADLQARIMSDPRMVQLRAGWSRCMAGQGYRYEASEELIDQLLSEAEQLEHEMLDDHHDLSPARVDAAIERFRQREIERAVADRECSERLAADAPAIIREYEVEFLAENEETIVRVLDGQRQAD